MVCCFSCLIAVWLNVVLINVCFYCCVRCPYDRQIGGERPKTFVVLLSISYCNSSSDELPFVLVHWKICFMCTEFPFWAHLQGEWSETPICLIESRFSGGVFTYSIVVWVWNYLSIKMPKGEIVNSIFGILMWTKIPNIFNFELTCLNVNILWLMSKYLNVECVD